MEPQELSCCYNANKKHKCKTCLDIISIILGILFVGIIGVLIGATISEIILDVLSAVIVLAVVMGILLILNIILLICKKNKND